jgi:hypothetical protein
MPNMPNADVVCASFSAQHLAVGWRLYIRVEYTFGVVGAARRLFFDATDRCPSSKALWLDAILVLRGVLDRDALRGVHDRAVQCGICFAERFPFS